MTRKVNIFTAGGLGIGGVAAGFFVPLFFGASITNINDYEVKLVPQGTSGTLEVVKDNRCNDKQHEGCLLFDVDKLGIVDFYLPGSKRKTKTCDDSDKVISRIQLTTTKGEGGTADDKGDFTELPLPNWIKNDAFPDVDLATGLVYEADPSYTGKGRVRLVNLNRNSYVEDEVMQFWYRVTVTNCEDATKTWTTDPRGDNEGTKF